MSTPPYAKIRVRINGGAPSGVAVEANPGDNVQFELESTIAVLQARWELRGFPPGWTAPAGWSTDSNGVIYSVDITPPDFDLPSQRQVDVNGLWGKWIPTVVINNASTDPDNPAYDTEFFDYNKGCGVEIVSPNGFHDLAPYEEAQFGGARAQWAGPQQENLRALERLAGGLFSLTTTGSTPGRIGNSIMPNSSTRLVQMYAIGRKGAIINQAYLAKQQMFRRNANGVAEICNGSLDDLGSKIGNMSVTGNLRLNGDSTGYEAELVGGASDTIVWSVVLKYIEQAP